MSKIQPRWWIGALALAFVANFLVAHVYLPFSASPSVGIQTRFGSKEPRVWKVDPGSPAHSAGTRSGDLIKGVSADSLDSADEYYLLEQLISQSDGTVITVERSGKQLALKLKITGTYFESLSDVDRFALLFWILIGALELAVAAFLAFGRPHDSSALSASLFLAVLTGLNSQSAGSAAVLRALPLFLRAIIYPVSLLPLEMLFFAFFFCANFPRPLFRRNTWIKLSVPAVLIYAYMALLNLPLCFGAHPAQMFQIGVGVYFETVKIPSLLVLCGYGVAAVIVVIVNFRRCDIAERRRIKLMLVGGLIGLASIVPAAIIHDLIHSDLVSRSGLISIGFGLLRIIFLACFVYAVVKQKVFAIPVLLQRSGRYLLVQRGYLFVLVTFGVLITAFFARELAQHVPATAGLSVPIGAAFGIALVWFGTIVHKRVQMQLDRAFFRSAYDAQQLLEEMAERSRRATSRSELAEILRARIHSALKPVRIAVLLETTPGRLTSFESNGSAMTLDCKTPSLLAVAKSAKPKELNQEDWESGALEGLSDLRPECLVPIIGRAEDLRGLLLLGSKLSEEPYSSEDLRLLQSAAMQAGVALENISLAEDIAVRLQAEQIAARELEIARSVQRKLLPDAAPVLNSLQCVGRCLQARQVGGDFYDFLEYAPGKLGLVLADIAGKGISAALLMANLQAHLRSHRVLAPTDIQTALASVNRLFRNGIEVGSFATLFLGFYDDMSNVLTYANCGHAPPAVMRRDGRVHRLEATATVLGAFADWRCDVEEVKLEEGDVLVLYSDGITEAENENGEQFGEARLLELLHGCRDLAADQLLETIIGTVLDFSHNQQIDDITLVIAQAKAVPKLLHRAASSSHMTQ